MIRHHRVTLQINAEMFCLMDELLISDRKVITYLSNGEWVDLFQFSLDGSSFEVGNIGSGAKATRNPGTVVK